MVGRRPTQCNSTNVYSRLFRQDINSFLAWYSVLVQSGKVAITFELMIQFKILQDLECSKAEQHSIFLLVAITFNIWSWRRHKHSFHKVLLSHLINQY